MNDATRQKIKRWAEAIRVMESVRLEMDEEAVDVFKECRRELGMSMRTFAEHLGRKGAAPTICNIENGKERVTKPFVVLLDNMLRREEER